MLNVDDHVLCLESIRNECKDILLLCGFVGTKHFRL